MFGFGKGKIDIIIPKSSYVPGEEISGTVTMDLKKHVNARGVKIRIFAVKRVTDYHNGHRSSHDQEVFSFEMPLDGEKEYPALSTYNYLFKIQVPTNAIENDTESPIAAGLMKAVSVLSGRSTIARWYLEAKLDIPNGFDINKKIQISVTQPAQGPMIS